MLLAFAIAVYAAVMRLAYHEHSFGLGVSATGCLLGWMVGGLVGGRVWGLIGIGIGWVLFWAIVTAGGVALLIFHDDFP